MSNNEQYVHRLLVDGRTATLFVDGRTATLFADGRPRYTLRRREDGVHSSQTGGRKYTLADGRTVHPLRRRENATHSAQTGERYIPTRGA